MITLTFLCLELLTQYLCMRGAVDSTCGVLHYVKNAI